MFFYLFTAAINSSAETRFCSPCLHILQHNFALIHLVFTYDSDKRNILRIGIAHLFFFHLGGIREDFGTDTCCTHFTKTPIEKAASFSPKLMNNTSVPFTASFG